MKKTSVSNLDNPSESMKSNKIDKRRPHAQPDIASDKEEKAEEMLQASNIQWDAKSTTQNIAYAEETPN